MDIFNFKLQFKINFSLKTQESFLKNAPISQAFCQASNTLVNHVLYADELWDYGIFHGFFNSPSRFWLIISLNVDIIYSNSQMPSKRPSREFLWDFRLLLSKFSRVWRQKCVFGAIWSGFISHAPNKWHSTPTCEAFRIDLSSLNLRTPNKPRVRADQNCLDSKLMLLITQKSLIKIRKNFYEIYERL